MAKSRRTWVYSPRKGSPPKVPDDVKREVERAASELIEKVLKPKYILPPPENAEFNYVADLHTKWHRSYYYFCATYNCPSPRALSPSFETRFARLAHAGGERFNLAFMRYTGQWIELYQALSLAECMKAIAEEPYFQP